MKNTIFIGIDGGATKTAIRIETHTGELLGQLRAGPASIRLSTHDAWQAILAGIQQILALQHMDLDDPQYAFYAGFGLAGCEMPAAYQTFMQYPHPFARLVVTSDAHIACLAAHAGQDGAIIIVGTGVVGYQLTKGKTAQVGGWGFPHDDIGGGAWLGMHAVRLTLQAYDKRASHSVLTDNIQHYFQQDLTQLVNWANQATPRLFASLAPLVIAASTVGDEAALALLQQSAAAINHIDQALLAAQEDRETVLPCALAGSVAPFIATYVARALQARLRRSLLTPEQGAILYLKQQLQTAGEGEKIV